MRWRFGPEIAIIYSSLVDERMFAVTGFARNAHTLFLGLRIKQQQNSAKIAADLRDDRVWDGIGFEASAGRRSRIYIFVRIIHDLWLAGCG